MWSRGKPPLPPPVTVRPDGTALTEPIELTDLPDGQPHPLRSWALRIVDPFAPGAVGQWAGMHAPPTHPVKVTCGRCGARWLVLWSDRDRVHANIGYRWAPAPAGYSPCTLVVRCSCKVERPINLAKLVDTATMDAARWQRGHEIIIGAGRHAERHPERSWPRSNPARGTASRATG